MNQEQRRALGVRALRSCAGAAIGLVTGTLTAIAAMLMLEMSPVEGGGILAFALAVYVVPSGAAVGLLVGIIAGLGVRLKTLAKSAGAVLATALLGLMIFSMDQDERYEKSLLRTMEPDGCHNEYRGLDYNAKGGFLSFERLCGEETRGTMNLSLISEDTTDSSRLLPKGAGNVLVMEVPEARGRAAFPARMSVSYERNGRVQIRYDRRAHVISQHASVSGVDFEFVPDDLP